MVPNTIGKLSSRRSKEVLARLCLCAGHAVGDADIRTEGVDVLVHVNNENAARHAATMPIGGYTVAGIGYTG